MKIYLPKYIWYYAGSFLPNTTVEEVDEDFMIPKNTFAYRIEGKDGMNYVGGRVYTYDEVCKEFPGDEYRILRSNAEGMKGTVRTRLGNFQQFDPDKDHLVSRDELEQRNFIGEL